MRVTKKNDLSRARFSTSTLMLDVQRAIGLRSFLFLPTRRLRRALAWLIYREERLHPGLLLWGTFVDREAVEDWHRTAR